MKPAADSSYAAAPLPTPVKLDLTLAEGKITHRLEVPTGQPLKALPKALTQKKLYKLYAYKVADQVQYIGMTQMSLTTRFWYGASTKYKYRYQFLHHPQIRLYVWLFPEMGKRQLENIEAELAYLVRRKTGRWPECQNEIHFNNDFAAGAAVAAGLYEQLSA